MGICACSKMAQNALSLRLRSGRGRDRSAPPVPSISKAARRDHPSIALVSAGKRSLRAANCAAFERCYYLPVSMVEGRRLFHLRLGPPRNNQHVRINWAADFELGAVAQLEERLAGSQKATGSSPV